MIIESLENHAMDMRYKENPLISVVIPIYNVEVYLVKCLDSVINQTYGNLEIILVNDGSTDNSPLICDKYANRDSRVKVIHQNNKGLVGARKSGISIATGDIATFVDSDDWIDLDMYEVMVRKMIESEADIVTSGLIRDYGEYIIRAFDAIKPGVYLGNELEMKIKNNLIDEKDFFRSNISQHVYNKLFERKLLLKNELLIPEDINVGEDAACTYPCILEANKIVVIDQCFYHYRIRNNSIMGQSNLSDIVKIKVLYEYLYQIFDGYSNRIILQEQLRLLIIFFVLLAYPQQLIKSKNNCLFYYPQIKKGAKIIVYGAGRAGKALIRALKDNNDYKVVLWVDKNSLNDGFGELEYDYIIIAAYTYSAYKDIYINLMNKRIAKEKIADLDLTKVLHIDEIF